MTEVLEKRIGIVDTIFCILAVVSERLRAENPGTLGISMDEAYDGFHELQRKNPDNKALGYIDFDRTGGVWCSRALYNFFFMGGVWGGIQETRISNRVGYQIPREASKRRMEETEREYGQEAVKEIERMASDFLDFVRRKDKKCP